jgi:hypothetical protein
MRSSCIAMHRLEMFNFNYPLVISDWIRVSNVINNVNLDKVAETPESGKKDKLTLRRWMQR